MLKQFNVTGMSCAACVSRVEKVVQKVPGVTNCSVSLLTNSMSVEGEINEREIIAAVEAAGYHATSKKHDIAGGVATEGAAREKFLEEESINEKIVDNEINILKKRLVASVLFLLILMYFSMGHTMFDFKVPGLFEQNAVAIAILELVLTSIIMLINQRFFISGFRSAVHLSPNMDTLVALGSMVSFAYSVVMLFAMTRAQIEGGIAAADRYIDELYFESAAMILVFITLGKTLEAISKGKTTDALKSLMKLAPQTATIIHDGEEEIVPIENVKVDDIFAVKPGESIPVDGVIIEGNSAVNESALTGESIPVDKIEGDEVAAATINQSGYLMCKATRVGKDTTLSKIIEMVSDAAATKAPIAKIADKVAGIFVPCVLLVALVTFIVWIIAGADVGAALTFATSVLVISCPCSLGLATPVAIMVGNGVGAKNGILFKTAAALESAGRIQIVALDKTGTITKGEPQVTDICTVSGIDSEELLRIAYAVEAKSEHPLAKAIVDRAITDKIELTDTKNTEVIPGKGIKAELMATDASETVSGTDIRTRLLAANNIEVTTGKNRLLDLDDESNSHNIYVYGGNELFIEEIADIPLDMKERALSLSMEGKTPLYFAINKKLIGMIAVADVIKEDATQAIFELKNMGISVVMITGDNEKTAKTIADMAGIDLVASNVLPGGKEEVIKKLKNYGKVAMVGDGINDAPALTRADIGVAIGSGTDVAIDAADIVLMKGKLCNVPAMIRLGRATLRNIHQNLFWAFFYNSVGIPIAAGVLVSSLGLSLNPMLGALAMSLSSFCVVTNALRLNLVDIFDGKKDGKLSRRIKRNIPRDTKQRMGKNTVNYSYIDINENKDINNAISELLADKSTKTINKEEMKMTKTIKITGMMCPHCEARVKEALEGIAGVEKALVSHEKGTAVVTCDTDISDEVLKTAVEQEKYSVVRIER